MKSIRYIAFGAVLIAGQAIAQDLSTEVVVDRTIQPKERAATRLGGLTPTVVLPTVTSSPLAVARYTSLSPLTRSYTRLDPADGAYAAQKTPYKGYAALGYFPVMNLGASAGYRFVDNEKLTLGAALQFDGEKYSPFNNLFKNRENSQYYTHAGVGLGFRPSAKYELTALIDYSFLRQRTYLWDWHDTNTFGLDLGWTTKTSISTYTFGLYGKYEKDEPIKTLETMEMMKDEIYYGLDQTRFGASMSVSRPFAETSRFGVDVNADFINTSHREYYNRPKRDKLIGTIGVKPFYGLSQDNFSATIGIDVDYGVNDNGKLHVAPDINLQWAVSSQAGVWLRAGGGDRLNPFSKLRQITNYRNFLMGYRRSNIPIIIEGGVNFGPFSGFTTEVYGGYAKANNWTMAQSVLTFFPEEVDIKGWHAGVRLGYEWRMLKFTAGGEIAPSDYDNAWLYNYDRAKYIINAGVEATPIEKLTVGLGFEFRGHRGYSFDPDEWYSLGDKSNLSVHAEYAFSPAFTVFARGENLLGRRYGILGTLPSQKQHGAIGVAVKF